jgi:uncharacterized protein
MISDQNTGLSELDISKINAVFSRNQNIERVILYGSRALGTFKPASDIDLTCIGENISLSQLQEIENELDDLLLPYKIDLSLFKSIGNPDLIEHIKRVGKPFYKK